MKFARNGLILAIVAAGVIWVNGCSKDDSSNNGGNNNNGASIYIVMKANALFRYNNIALDSLNNTTGASWQYEAAFKKGSYILGAYNDWYFRIGTDKRDNSKDTVYVRVNTGSASGSSFTKEVQMYGFQYQIFRSFVEMITTLNPGITPPSIPGEQWDVVAMFHKDDGTSYDVGATWTIGNPNGLDLGFAVSGLPASLSVNVKMTGKLESKAETYQNGSINCKAWKSTVYVTLSSTLFKQPAVIKLSFWLSDNPAGIVKLVQESTTLEFADIIKPFIGNGFSMPGEKSESYEYSE
jgi:hypothetical protein